MTSRISAASKHLPVFIALVPAYKTRKTISVNRKSYTDSSTKKCSERRLVLETLKDRLRTRLISKDRMFVNGRIDSLAPATRLRNAYRE
jgi:hypothetical protein